LKRQWCPFSLKVSVMKRTLLDRLRINGYFYIISALLLLLVIPSYQLLVLNPNGFSTALAATGTDRYATYLAWIGSHIFQFLSYRLLLILAFALLITLPFSLYRIIVAQEILAQQQREAEEQSDNDTDVEADENMPTEDEHAEPAYTANDGMPAYAWRGRGFAVLAAWAGFVGLIIYVLASLASTSYFSLVDHNTISNSVLATTSLLTILTNTVGIGLLGLGALFSGAMIARTGTNLWPGIWVAFGYVSLFVGGLLCIGALAVAATPGTEQSSLTTIATLLLALWTLWLGLMLVRLKPEA
jgi:hypothetical protein